MVEIFLNLWTVCKQKLDFLYLIVFSVVMAPYFLKSYNKGVQKLKKYKKMPTPQLMDPSLHIH